MCDHRRSRAAMSEPSAGLVRPLEVRVHSALRDGRARRRRPVAVVTTPAGRPVWYPPEAVLTTEEVAAVLGVNPKTVTRWPIRGARLGHKTTRYLFRDVVEFIASRAV